MQITFIVIDVLICYEMNLEICNDFILSFKINFYELTFSQFRYNEVKHVSVRSRIT